MEKKKIFVVTGTPKDRGGEWNIDPEVITKSYCASINVSDNQCGTFDLQNMGFPAFWFPINEVGKWEHSPFFGALNIVKQYYKGDKPVHIHCHAGANRSPSIAFAILRAMDYTNEEAEQALNYPDFAECFQRNVDRGHIPKNIVEFLKAAIENPHFTSLSQILRKMDGWYDEWAQRKFDEQENYTLKVGDEETGARLVYNRDKKKYTIVK